MSLLENSGLTVLDIEIIRSALRKFSVKKAFLFGSRAMGNYKRGSDIDLAVVFASASADSLHQLSSQLNHGSHLPYKFDVLDLDQLDDESVKEHIRRYGIIFFDAS